MNLQIFRLIQIIHMILESINSSQSLIELAVMIFLMGLIIQPWISNSTWIFSLLLVLLLEDIALYYSGVRLRGIFDIFYDFSQDLKIDQYDSWSDYFLVPRSPLTIINQGRSYRLLLILGLILLLIWNLR